MPSLLTDGINKSPFFLLQHKLFIIKEIENIHFLEQS